MRYPRTIWIVVFALAILAYFMIKESSSNLSVDSTVLRSEPKSDFQSIVPSNDVEPSLDMIDDQADTAGSGISHASATGPNSIADAKESFDAELETVLPIEDDSGLAMGPPEAGDSGMELVLPEAGDSGMELVLPEEGDNGLEYIPPDADDPGLNYD